MADIKTELRELSVGLTLGLLINNEGVKFDKNLLHDSTYFYNQCLSLISQNETLFHNLKSITFFNDDYKKIINNGYKLACAIYFSDEFMFCKTDKIEWLGFDTQKRNPVDLKVGNYMFSLKEDSFILQNMGLYSLLNNLTDSSYGRGLNVFSTFAPNEYDNWFSYTWNLFVEFLKKTKMFQLINEQKTKKAFAYIDNNFVVLQFNNEVSKVPISINTNAQYMQYTSSKTREQVFSKWINQYANNDTGYLTIKKNCSETAGISLCNKIKNEFNERKLCSFFQIYDFTYYYAKTTATETTILKVPSISEFNTIIKFVDCISEVPSSQLNIITSFQNVITGKILQFRNECRFSHGQFNGTPEAKMYVVKNTPLCDLYIPIINTH